MLIEGLLSFRCGQQATHIVLRVVGRGWKNQLRAASDGPRINGRRRQQQGQQQQRLAAGSNNQGEGPFPLTVDR